MFKSGLAVVFGLSVLVMGGVLSGQLDVGTVYDLSNVAVAGGLFSFAGAAILSNRTLGDLETWEYGAAGFALAFHAVVYLGTPTVAVDLLANQAPWAGLGAAAVSYVGYWAVAFRGM